MGVRPLEPIWTSSHRYRKKIESLAPGDYTPGLNAVLLHIETAFRHLSRGQDTDDDTAFTDAIYRTNQAFEGSIKEAFRVLASKSPDHMRPYDIENHLQKENIFRPRVLSQFTTYRTDWRNPSAHDYKLDFDESEAFLAIISVTAFACLLLDQIAERLAFLKSKAEAEAIKEAIEEALAPVKNEFDRTLGAIQEFCRSHMPTNNALATSEAQLVGSLHGFLASAVPDIWVESEVALGDQRAKYHADLLVSRENVEFPVEIKRTFSVDRLAGAIQQVQKYAELIGSQKAILVFLPSIQGETVIEEFIPAGTNLHISVVLPEGLTGHSTRTSLLRSAAG